MKVEEKKKQQAEVAAKITQILVDFDISSDLHEAAELDVSNTEKATKQPMSTFVQDESSHDYS